MMKAFATALVLALGATAALAEDDDDKVPEADTPQGDGRSRRSRLQGPRGGQEGGRGHLRDRRCQVQDGHDGHQARQGLLGHSYFALLTGHSSRATRTPHYRDLSGPPKDGPDLRPVFILCSRVSCRARRERRQALNCAQLRILLCTSARVYATLAAWRPTSCISGRQDRRMRLPWPRSMPKLGAAPIAGSSRISRLNAWSPAEASAGGRQRLPSAVRCSCSIS